MRTSRPLVRLLAAVLMLTMLVGSAAPVRASIISPSNPRPSSSATIVVFADSVSWRGFTKYWKGFVNRADRVVLVVALVAVAALFIITRGKWLK